MSAFIVSHKHITAMLNYAAAHDVRFHWTDDSNTTLHYDSRNTDDAQTLGAILLKENIRSVCARYPQDKIQDYLWMVEDYRYTLGSPVCAVQALKACECYMYQTCETQDHTGTFAWRIAEWIKSRAIGNLPGYDAAQWEIE